MRSITLFASIVLAAATSSTIAPADALETRLVAAARITLGDVVPSAPEAVRDIDLGASPAPGGSRIVSKEEIVRTLNRSGISAPFTIAWATRITRKKDHLTGHAIMELSRAPITESLPAGVTLTRVEIPTDLDVPEGTHIASATLPKLPKARGPFHTTAKLSLMAGEEHVADIPIGVTVDISEAAAAHDVKKGARVMVIVERDTLRVQVEGTLTRDADVGELTQVALVSTGHSLHVKLLTKTTSELLESR